MNAIAPRRPDSAEDNIRRLEELIDYGMQLAHAVAKKALQQMAESGPAEDSGATSAAKTPDGTLLFLRLWGSVRQTMALKARLAARLKPQPSAASGTEPTSPRSAPQPTALSPDEAARLEQLARELARSGKAAGRFSTSLSPATTFPFQPAPAVKR